MKLKMACLYVFLAVQAFVLPVQCVEGTPAPGQAAPPERQEEAGRLPKGGYRVMSLEFDSDRVLYISPGDSVDVTAVVDIFKSLGKAERSAVTFLNAKRVVAVKPAEASNGKSLVQLELSPLEAMALASASPSSDIWLFLRKKGRNELPMNPIASWKYYLKDHLKNHLKGEVVLRRRDDGRQDCSVGEQRAALPPWNSADRSAVIASVQERMIGGAMVALGLPLPSDKVVSVRPGDRVDVLATFGIKYPQRHVEDVTVMPLQNIMVLDVRKSDSHAGQSVLLLEMNWETARYAVLAWNTADVQLILRPENDTDTFPFAPVPFGGRFR